MPTPIQKIPPILLAFANDEPHSLLQLAKEHDALQEALRQVEREHKCAIMFLKFGHFKNNDLVRLPSFLHHYPYIFITAHMS